MSVSTLLRLHSGVKILAKKLRGQMGERIRTCPLRGNEEISASYGRVRVSMMFEDNSAGRRHLQELNSIPHSDETLDMIHGIPMWSIEIMEDRIELPHFHSNYVGYIAMDQIIRCLDEPDKLFSDKGSMEIIGSIRRLAWELD